MKQSIDTIGRRLREDERFHGGDSKVSFESDSTTFHASSRAGACQDGSLMYELADNGVRERFSTVFENYSTKSMLWNSTLKPGHVIESQPRTAQIDQGTRQDVPFIGNKSDDNLRLRKEAATFT
jgi:hypothetical protein